VTGREPHGPDPTAASDPPAGATAVPAQPPPQPPPFAAALGGPLGLAEASVPGAVFVIAFTLTRAIAPSAWVAAGTAAALTIIRLLRRESPRQALSGILGVAACAFVASRSGRAQDYYLPGLLINVAYAALYSVSVAVRWPLVGVIVGPLRGEGMSWRGDERVTRAYVRATWIWVGVFCLRILVQAPLYLAGAVVWLGVARVAMGLPLFGLAGWLTWLLVRRVPSALPAAAAR